MILCKVFKVADIEFLGDKAHPFSLFIIMQFCILSLPGVILISFFNFESRRYVGIDESLRASIGYWYLYSVFVYFSVAFMLFYFFRCNWYSRYIAERINNKENNVLFGIVLCLAITLFLLKVIFSKPAPLWYLLLGDARTAYIVRVDMQLNHDKYYIPYVSKFISQYLVYQFYFCLYYCFFALKKSNKLYFGLVLSFIMATIECLYDTQKAPFIFMLVGALFIFYLKKQSFLKTVFPVLFIFLIVIVMQSVVSGSDLSVGLSHAVDRFILGQNQGFYHIINSINPDPKYWFNGFYLTKQLGLEVSRADVDVLPYTIYKNSDIVNVNSYYLGEAWSMFGFLGLVISPFVVAIMTFVYVKVIDLLIGDEALMTIPFMIYFVPTINVQQSFNYFLYSKSFCLSLFLFIVTIVLVKAIRSFIENFK
jgi:oligosaccharide repeat unit polymerase